MGRPASGGQYPDRLKRQHAAAVALTRLLAEAGPGLPGKAPIRTKRVPQRREGRTRFLERCQRSCTTPE